MPNTAIIRTAQTRIPDLESVIDGIPETTHVVELEKSDEPLEDGTSITDHAVTLPTRLKLVGWCSNMHGVHPSQTWQRLRQIAQAKVPVSVFTEQGVYHNMLFEKCEGFPEGRGLRIQMNLVEIIRVGDPQVELPVGSTSGPATERPGSLDRGRIPLLPLPP